MSKITNLKIIKHFKSDSDNAIHGIYECDFKGENHVFIRHGGEVGVVSFWLGEPLNKCISIVREDIAIELADMVNKILRTSESEE